MILNSKHYKVSLYESDDGTIFSNPKDDRIEIKINEQTIGWTSPKLLNTYVNIISNFCKDQNTISIISSLVKKRVIIPVYLTKQLMFKINSFKAKLESYFVGVTVFSERTEDTKILLFINSAKTSEDIFKVTLHELTHYFYNIYNYKIRNYCKNDIINFYNNAFKILSETNLADELSELKNINYNEIAIKLYTQIDLNERGKLSPTIKYFANHIKVINNILEEYMIKDLEERNINLSKEYQDFYYNFLSQIITKIRYIMGEIQLHSVEETKYPDALFYLAYKEALGKIPRTLVGQEWLYCSEIIAIIYSEKPDKFYHMTSVLSSIAGDR